MLFRSEVTLVSPITFTRDGIVHEVRLADGQDLKVVESRSHGARLQPPGRAVTITLADGAAPNAFPPPP